MKSFVFFTDKKMFDPNKIWRLEEVLRRFRKTEIYSFSIIIVKAGDKELQRGLCVDAKDELSAIDIYQRLIENGRNK